MHNALILVLILHTVGSIAKAQDAPERDAQMFTVTIGEIRLAEDVEIEDIKTMDDFRDLKKAGKVTLNEKLIFDVIEGRKLNFAFEKLVNRVTSMVTRLGKTQATYDQVSTGTKVTLEVESRDDELISVELQYEAVRVGPVPDDESVPQSLSEIALTTDSVVAVNSPKFLVSRSSDEPTFIMIMIAPIK